MIRGRLVPRIAKHLCSFYLSSDVSVILPQPAM